MVFLYLLIVLLFSIIYTCHAAIDSTNNLSEVRRLFEIKRNASDSLLLSAINHRDLSKYRYSARSPTAYRGKSGLTYEARIPQTSLYDARYGATKFSHLTDEQFKDLYLSDLRPISNTNDHVETVPASTLQNLGIPKQLDWRTYLNYSAVTPVKDQNKCGGCWAFSAVETIESMVSITTHKPPPSLSVQEVIDCSYNNYGCDGGDTSLALLWLRDSEAPLVSDKAYPLTDVSNFCKMTNASTTDVKVYVQDYRKYSGIREDNILELLQHGPVSAAVDARTWKNYQGGIIQYHCEPYINHAVQIVGYDLTGDVPYYIVRNSWGTDFGHDGYIYIKVGTNVCGIAHEISTVTVKM